MTILVVRELDLEGKKDYYTSLEEGEVGLRTFFVQTNDATHTQADIITAVTAFDGSAGPLGLFPGSTNAQCVKIHPTRPWKDRLCWQTTHDYKSILNQQELQRSAHPVPTDRTTAISGQSRTVMEPRRRLLRTPPYKLWSEAGPGAGWVMGSACNSATDPLDPPIDVAVTEWILHCEKNVSTFPSWFLTYGDGVNNADQAVTVRGTTVTIPKGCGKLENFTFSPERKENGTAFITIGWNVIVKVARPLFSTETDKFGPWDVERLDEGARTYSVTAGKWTNIRDTSNQSVNLPVPLDGNGAAINTTGARIPETDLWWSAYRPHGVRVDYSVIPWS